MTLLRTSLAGLLSVGVVAGSVAAAPTSLAANTPTAAAVPTASINAGLKPCAKYPDLKGKKPGRLLRYREVPVDPTLLTGARMFRVMFTTTGLDERHVQAACGLVVIPTKGLTNEVVAWSHGTVGVHQSCQPSNNPVKFLSGGAIKYGSVNGTTQNGIWQGLVDQGRLITATDYYSAAGRRATKQQNYVAGVPAGAAVLDSVRTGIQLVKKVRDQQRKKWKLGIWGASQGGAAALWAGQLANRYLVGTARPGQPPIKLMGVLANVPASSFVATHKSPRSLLGRHLGDMEMHTAMTEIAGKPVGSAGPILFSLVMSSWHKYADSGQPSRNALFPGYPRGVRPDLPAVLTPEGIGTANVVEESCVSESALIPLLAATQKYLDNPADNPFFIPTIWGKENKSGQFQGRLDRTCRKPSTAAGIKKWCTWLAYNMPGPDGINPFPKLPHKADGSPAPVMIAEGMDDTLIYCQNNSPTVPAARDCMARQLYDSMATKRTCKATSVTLNLFAKTATSPASHLSTTFQLADNGNAEYRGSPMDRFLNKSFSNKIRPGCAAQILNK